MTGKTYLRPIGFVFGADARPLIAAGDALPLGGLPHVAFTRAEEIAREGARRVISLDKVADSDALQRLSAVRPTFGGLEMDRCRIMGIVNVTPDSFSDGGRLETAQAAIRHGKRLADEGADLLDIGGESTRPGSDAVDVDEEKKRILPVIEALSVAHIVSADTRKADVMAAALGAGARIINDVSALQHDPASATVCAKSQAPVVLMHSQGEPKTMQLNPRYNNVLLDVYDRLETLVAQAEAAGMPRARICIDPGIGFGKTFKQNLELMAGLSLFQGLGVPVLVGLSRKGFVGAVTGEKVAAKRVAGSIGGALAAVMQGAHILRVHDVVETRQAMEMFTASADPDSVDL